MDEIKKTCHNCKHYDCSPLEDPCKTCLVKGFTNQEFDTMWEPKEDEKDDNLEKVIKLIRENGIYGIGFKVPVYPDTVFKTENDHKIDHIDKRVDDIQHNVLVYGNDAISKIIKLDDRVSILCRADDYLSKKCYDINAKLKDIDTRIDGLESMLKDIQKSLETVEEGISNTEENVFNAIFHPELVGTGIKQFTVDEKPVQPELEEAHKRLKKMTKSEPKFKPGDIVKYKTGLVNYIVSNVRELKTGYCYDLERKFPYGKRNYKITGILESRLEGVK